MALMETPKLFGLIPLSRGKELMRGDVIVLQPGTPKRKSTLLRVNPDYSLYISGGSKKARDIPSGDVNKAKIKGSGCFVRNVYTYNSDLRLST